MESRFEGTLSGFGWLQKPSLPVRKQMPKKEGWARSLDWLVDDVSVDFQDSEDLVMSDSSCTVKCFTHYLRMIYVYYYGTSMSFG